ncbi:dynamin family protein [uncultured Mobiluncus sp.]|uniref:dynamin family protein n=1 Tax=uncultured Mobiluncus sp. TaxID=293425 RepID=UPI0025FB9576|nr:dynamin family protein [uncultured Mobiluncus sp.]
MSESPAVSLDELAGQLEDLNFGFPAAQATALKLRNTAVSRLREHLSARGTDLDGPLVAVLAGSTGVGKSTILNSLVGAQVPTSVRRPTTLTPVLVYHPDDELWLAADRILGGFEKIRLLEDDAWDDPAVASAVPERVPAGEDADTAPLPRLILRSTTKMSPGMCLIDCPDLDSYLDTNRDLAQHLLEVADLWIFVTTANRYRDEPGLELLRKAARRDVAIGAVLNRVTQGSLLAAKQDLSAEIADSNLKDVPIFAIMETQIADGELPAEDLVSLRNWLDNLAGDALMHSAMARQTLFGSLHEVLDLSEKVFDAAAAETEMRHDVQQTVDRLEQQLLDFVEAQIATPTWFQGEPADLLEPCVRRQLEVCRAENSWIRQRLKWKNTWLNQQVRPDLALDAVKRAVASSVSNLDFQMEQIIDEAIEDSVLPDSGCLSEETAPPLDGSELMEQWSLTPAECCRQAGWNRNQELSADEAQTLFLAVLFAGVASPETCQFTRVDELLGAFFDAATRLRLRSWSRSALRRGLQVRVSQRIAALRQSIPDPDNSELITVGRKTLRFLREEWS